MSMHTRITLSLSRSPPKLARWIPAITKLLIAWQSERGGPFGHMVAPLLQAWALSPRASRRLARRQPLAVVDLLIDAAIKTHWKSPGTGPTTWTYALFFMHVAPSIIAPSNITENILCSVLKMTVKPSGKSTEVV